MKCEDPLIWAIKLNDYHFFILRIVYMLIHVGIDAVINNNNNKKRNYIGKSLSALDVSLLFLVRMGDVSAAVQFHKVRCVTGTIHAVMNKEGWGAPLPVVCKICQQDWHFDDGYLKRHSRLWESQIICVVLLKTLGDTTQGSYSPPKV